MHFTRVIFLLTFLPGLYFAQKLSKSTSAFIENKGQIVNQEGKANNDVLFMYTGKGLNVQLRKKGYSYELYALENVPPVKPGRRSYIEPTELAKMKTITSRVDIDFEGMNNDLKIIKGEAIESVLNYVTNGKEIYGVKSFQKITYKNIYNNIDIEFILTKDARNPLKYNIILRPGADINDVKFLCKGASSITKTNDDVQFSTALGVITEKIPFSYYKNNPEQNIVVGFKLNGDRVYFESNYDKSKTLVIDPTSNVIWSTYYGGSGFEYCNATGVDSQNNVYITGQTLSTSNIATNGVYQSTLTGGTDIYLTKFSSSGNLIWGTYLGGANFEQGFALFVEPNGVVYVCGDSGSNSNIASPLAHQTVYGGGIDDGVLAKFDANGQRLWSTYFGGNLHDYAYCITKNSSGEIIIGGHTESVNTGNCIATAGSYLATYSFLYDGFLAKFNSSGTRQWSTYFGESGNEEVWGVATDATGNIYFTGFTSSLNNIATNTGHQQIQGGNVDGFIAKIDPSGTNLLWGTYYGGEADDQAAVIEVNAAGDVFVSGNTASSNSISTPGSYQPSMGSADDVFLTRFNSNGVRQWGTYYGGNDAEYVYDLLLDSQSNLYICGQTMSTNSISANNPYQPNIGQANTYDAYFAKFNPAGNSLIHASYFGSIGADAAKGIALDNTDKIILAGETTSTVGIASPGAYMGLFGGGQDAFVAKFCQSSKPQISPAGTPTICTNETYTLTAAAGYTSYFWNNGASTNSIVIGGAFLPGTYHYSVAVNDFYGCNGSSDSVSVVVADCVIGLEENIKTMSLKLFPVPANEFVSIDSSLPLYDFQIYSAIGQLLLSGTLNPEKTINVKDFAPGIYFLKCFQGQNIISGKFVKN